MTTSEVLSKFPGLTRDLLYFWEKKGWIKPQKTRRGGRKRQRREYTEEEAHRIGLMFKSYAEGYRPEHAYRRTSLAKALKNPDLEALFNSNVTMMKSILLSDPQETLEAVATTMYGHLQAECCSIFLVPEDSPRELVLEISQGDLGGDATKLRIPIRSVPKGGLTGHIAYVGETVSLHGFEIENNPYRAGRLPRHLPSGVCFSLLAVPLKDRKNRLVGLIKVENKKGRGGKPSKDDFFDSSDQLMAQILANDAVLVLESLRLEQASLRLLEAMTSARDLPGYLGEVLGNALPLLHADRGDVTWWDEHRKKSVIVAQTGESNLNVGQDMPLSSMTRQVFESGLPRIIDDVNDRKSDDSYYPCNERTRSELAVPLWARKRKCGVLNVESFTAKAFDRQDQAVLDRLARYATLAAHMVSSRDEIYARVVEQKTEHSLEQEDLLKSILQSVEIELGLDAGVIYIADHQNCLLRCTAARGCENLNVDIRNFRYSFDANSLASRVFRDKIPYFSADPQRDPNVAQEGIRAFDVHGALLGVPLIFRSIVVGVLVSWSRLGRQPVESDTKLLQRFSRLAVTTIAIADTDKEQAKALKKIRNVLVQMRSGATRSKILYHILHTVLTTGFDRARIFEFKPSQNDRFECVASLSSAGGEDIEMPGKFEGITIEPGSSPYVKLTLDAWSSNPNATIRDPNDPSGLGPDPNADLLEKSQDLEWAIAPLIINQSLHGYVAADNKYTRRPITRRSLEYLTLVAAIAAQAIASFPGDESFRGSTNIQSSYQQNL